MNIENENDILSKIPLDMPMGPYLLGYAQAIHDLNKDWDTLHREAAKDILPAVIAKKSSMCSFEEVVKEAVQFADELIRQLKKDEE